MLEKDEAGTKGWDNYLLEYASETDEAHPFIHHAPVTRSEEAKGSTPKPQN